MTIYTAGGFTNGTNFSNGYNYVAKWNGSSWSKLGGNKDSSFNSVIWSTATDAKGYVYAAGGFTNGINYSIGHNYVAKWDGNIWRELGGTEDSFFNNGFSSIITDNNGNVYAAGNFTNGNGKEYIAKYNQSALPVKLSYFTATANNKTIQTTWHTSTELNTANFIIQHSTDGTSFSDIGTVKAIGSGANNYNFTDTHPTNGTNYYRLKSVDKDGASSYSKTVSAEIVDSRYEILVVPNPVKSFATINGNHIAYIQMADNLGRVVKTVSLKDATNPTLSVGGLQAGVYHLRVQTTDGKVSGASLVVNY